jgi:hypothetical protein
MASRKEILKKVLGELPLTAEVYWLLRQSNDPLPYNFSLKTIRENLADSVAAAEESRKKHPAGKKVFLFASTHYWLEHVVMNGLALAGMGHDVTIGYYPYGKWNIDTNQFDLRRQNVYANTVLSVASRLIHFENMLRNNSSFTQLPDRLNMDVDQVTDYDFMYYLQSEQVDREDPFYQFRFGRNQHAAKALYHYLYRNRPDVAIIPNGTILEFGIAYRVCRFLKIPTSTYEFSDRRGAMWMAQNDEIMQQNTDDLWNSYANHKLTPGELEETRVLLSSRRNATTYADFTRKWQRIPAEGQNAIKLKLGLNDDPVILLATNVLGDSLTLGRNTFTKSMSEWIIRTIQYFMERPEVQLIIRIHPGEALVKHGTILDLIRKTLPELPPHIKLIEPLDEVNTYDLMDVADLGLVYTTTVGLEMALRGIPVVVAGKTHYRNRGFTHDPNTWVEYFKLLNRLLDNIKANRLTDEQVNLAWKYTYLFFFRYQLPFPWTMVQLRENLQENPLKEVLSANGMKKYRPTFNALTFSPPKDTNHGKTNAG